MERKKIKPIPAWWGDLSTYVKRKQLAKIAYGTDDITIANNFCRKITPDFYPYSKLSKNDLESLEVAKNFIFSDWCRIIETHGGKLPENMSSVYEALKLAHEIVINEEEFTEKDIYVMKRALMQIN